MLGYDRLLELQAADSRMDALTDAMQANPERARLAELQKLDRSIDAGIAQTEAARAEQDKKRKRLEDEMTALETKVKREEERLYSGKVGNPKELQGISDEVGHLKKKLDEVETVLLEEMEVLEKINSDLAKYERARERSHVEQERLSASIAAFDQKTEAEIAALRSEADALTNEIEPQLAAAYAKVRKDKRQAVARFVDGACAGCHVSLSDVEVDRMAHSDEIWRCSSCGRLLVR